jgi:hypothetical protein
MKKLLVGLAFASFSFVHSSSGYSLLEDPFTSDGSDVNSGLNIRQSGSFATQSWSTYPIYYSGNPVDGSTAFLSENSLNLEQGGSARLDSFALNSGNIPNYAPLTISFTLETIGGDSTDWTSFRFASSLNPNDPGSPVVDAGDFGFLYRLNSGIQMFSGGMIYEANSSPYGNNFSFSFFGSDGGSPFAGKGTSVTVTQGETTLGTFNLSQGFSGDRFIAFGNDGNPNAFNKGVVDNLVVSVPEPSTYALLGIGALALIMAARRRRRVQG